jgi:hypothetical protein
MNDSASLLASEPLALFSTIDSPSPATSFLSRFVVVVAVVIQPLDPIVLYQSSSLSGLLFIQQLKQSPAAAADSSSRSRSKK